MSKGMGQVHGGQLITIVTPSRGMQDMDIFYDLDLLSERKYWYARAKEGNPVNGWQSAVLLDSTCPPDWRPRSSLLGII